MVLRGFDNPRVRAFFTHHARERPRLTNVEHNNRQTIFTRQTDGCGIHHVQLFGQHIHIGQLLIPHGGRVTLTDLPDRLLAAELVREQIFLQTHEEVPYGTTVETESYKERPDGSVRIDATIYVGRTGHKAILIGERGQKIRQIGERARKQLSGLLERPCHLFLNVKERSGWDEERARLRAIGLDDVP